MNLNPYTIIIDPGHGGSDFGATYNGRKEKDDVLKLSMVVGEILEKNCINVIYTRTDDVYDTPFQKSKIANESDADLFVSFHRNAYEIPNYTSGVEVLVFENTGFKSNIATKINHNLEELGFVNRGIVNRPNLVVLKRTRMPAILVEVGFIDNDKDNMLFDEKFYEIAYAIAMGIIKTLKIKCDKSYPVLSGNVLNNSSKNDCDNIVDNYLKDDYIENDNDDNNDNYAKLYRVQLGAYNDRKYADELLSELKKEGYPAYIVFENGLYKVQCGAYAVLDNAVKMEEKLRRNGYSTFITS